MVRATIARRWRARSTTRRPSTGSTKCLLSRATVLTGSLPLDPDGAFVAPVFAKGRMMKVVWLSVLLSWTLLVAQAQGTTDVTLERVQAAVAATEKLAQAEIESGSVPGLA